MAENRKDKFEFLEWLDKSYSTFAKFLALSTGVLILIIAVLVFKEFIFRNFGHPSTWVSEVSELILMWVFLLPMAFSQIDGAMIRSTFLVEKFPKRIQKMVGVLSSLSGIVFGVLLLKASYGYFAQTSPGSYYPETGFPAIIQRAIVPISAVLLIFASLVTTLRNLRSQQINECIEKKNSERENR